jgi:hypothetical protein
VLLSSDTARAHSPFLLPNFFDVSHRDHVTVQGSFTEEFFSPDVAMKADDYHVIAPDGSKVPLKPVYTRDNRARGGADQSARHVPHLHRHPEGENRQGRVGE